MNIFLPDKIRSAVEGLTFHDDSIGMSDSCVRMFDDMVLKIEKSSGLTDRQSIMLNWLRGKLPVPEIICDEESDGMRYTLMTRIHGEMSCAEVNMLNPQKTVEAIAEGITMLQSVPIDDCPVKYTLSSMLDDAEAHIEKADHKGWAGHFETPENQLGWLRKNMPEDEFVLAHGDYCMPNVMLDKGHVSGFIDLGQSGTADKWYDIALMQQSLERNFSGYFGGRTYDGFSAGMLYDALGIRPDRQRLEFHLLLDELYSVW